ncbi:hypothetical protein Bca4012_006442 [Brassica carinata]|uniref:Uncharacterized protein n=1 Tax=Brassica carinata TaxID=52824 RepID=A0A8X7UVW6_BRACI|nr:hypothetical protein Bca52824_039363 [Brassica carinata]
MAASSSSSSVAASDSSLVKECGRDALVSSVGQARESSESGLSISVVADPSLAMAISVVSEVEGTILPLLVPWFELVACYPELAVVDGAVSW